jgi:hypothetical protein
LVVVDHRGDPARCEHPPHLVHATSSLTKVTDQGVRVDDVKVSIGKRQMVDVRCFEADIRDSARLSQGPRRLQSSLLDVDADD